MVELAKRSTNLHLIARTNGIELKIFNLEKKADFFSTYTFRYDDDVTLKIIIIFIIKTKKKKTPLFHKNAGRVL